MLAKLAAEHYANKNVIREMQEKKKNEAIVSAHVFSDQMVHHLNARVSHAYLNQKKIDVETKKLVSKCIVAQRQAENWIKLTENFNNVLKKLGDVESWVSTIDNDLNIVRNTLKTVHEGKQPTQ
uniref:Biogenesis of lysosome-related organelles complex 1 subunit 1 n=1 Tax=Rhabditophanes sp. KR3021 TaxID=114890 RepID=A0AC35U3Z1_9BILA